MFNNQFNIFDWYWKAENGRIFSSASQTLIKDTDKAYIAWLNTGNLPTPWPRDEQGNEADSALEEILAPHGLHLTPPSLDKIKADLMQRIDQAAERERLKYITNGVGQSMTYQEKVNQAAQYSKAYSAHQADPKNNPKPNDAEYLLLAAGLGIDGDTLIEAAQTVTFAYAQWQYVGAEIEKIRLQAKQAVDEAKTVEAAQTVYDGIKWPQV